MEQDVLMQLPLALHIEVPMQNVLSLWEAVKKIIAKELQQMQQLSLIVERDYVQILVQQVIKDVKKE
jgi:hypothetical protein